MVVHYATGGTKSFGHTAWNQSVILCQDQLPHNGNVHTVFCNLNLKFFSPLLIFHDKGSIWMLLEWVGCALPKLVGGWVIDNVYNIFFSINKYLGRKGHVPIQVKVESILQPLFRYLQMGHKSCFLFAFFSHAHDC